MIRSNVEDDWSDISMPLASATEEPYDKETGTSSLQSRADILLEGLKPSRETMQ